MMASAQPRGSVPLSSWDRLSESCCFVGWPVCATAEGGGEGTALTSAGLRAEHTPLAPTSVEVHGSWPSCLWWKPKFKGKGSVRAVRSPETRRGVPLETSAAEAPCFPAGPQSSGHSPRSVHGHFVIFEAPRETTLFQWEARWGPGDGWLEGDQVGFGVLLPSPLPVPAGSVILTSPPEKQHFPCRARVCVDRPPECTESPPSFQKLDVFAKSKPLSPLVAETRAGPEPDPSPVLSAVPVNCTFQIMPPTPCATQLPEPRNLPR